MIRNEFIAVLILTACLSLADSPTTLAQDVPHPGKEVGVVSNITILSNQVADVSSIEAWKASFIKPGMSDREKALAVWNTVVQFRHQDTPPVEYLHEDLCVHDPIKSFNVYGYGQCCCSASNILALARAVGLNARGRELRGHTVPEVEWNQDWHMLDPSLICYFTDSKDDVASVNEIAKDVRTWLSKNPDQRNKLASFMGNDGWKQGPSLLASCQFYNRDGRLPALSHGWHSTMGEYNGFPAVREQGYSMGYRVNVQLRPGEVLTRNWSNRGLHVNQDAHGNGSGPICIQGDYLKYSDQFGNLAPGRVGNGSRVWNVPLVASSLRHAALRYENLSVASAGQSAALKVDQPDKVGTLELRMPSSYVYLSGQLKLAGTVGSRGAVRLSFSRNHGQDWKEVVALTTAGSFDKTIDLRPLVHRLYEYRLRLVLQGSGTEIVSLQTHHDIQHSQRALPALAQGENTIKFSVGPPQATMTMEGNTRTSHPQAINVREFHPKLDGVVSNQYGLLMTGGEGSVTFPIETPGDLTGLRFGCHYRARSAKDGWNLDVSWDAGKSWQTVDRAGGPATGSCKYVSFDKIPDGNRKALVRFAGRQNNTAMMFSLRIDADYMQPSGGFRPVKTTYLWQENGQPQKHVHIARSPNETYVIRCHDKPELKSLIVELAD